MDVEERLYKTAAVRNVHAKITTDSILKTTDSILKTMSFVLKRWILYQAIGTNGCFYLRSTFALVLSAVLYCVLCTYLLT